MINHSLIVLARESRGLSQLDLSKLISITQGMLSKIEQGINPPSDETFNAICQKLNYPSGFFQQNTVIFEPTLSYYRKRVQLKKNIISKAEARMNIVRMNVEALLQSVELPDLNLPPWDIDIKGNEKLGASWLREFWNLPKGRIENLTKIIENNGILVIPFNYETEKIDGLSMFTKNNTPIIFYNKDLTGDRQRFTIAHELAHLILHFKMEISEGRDIEKEAMRFASELLLPSHQIKNNINFVNLEVLADLKRYWYVSMGAILMKLKEVNSITDSQYRYLWQQMSQKGYRTKEPVDIQVEKPTLYKELIDMHLNDLDYSKAELAALLKLEIEDVDDLYFNNYIKLKIVRN